MSLSDVSSRNPGQTATGSVTAEIATTARETLAYSGKIETFTIGVSGYYDITADGAQGGSGSNNYPSSAGLGGGGAGGLGAMASGDVYLQAGAKLEIVVGGAGGKVTASGSGGGGGGGGSFVIETNSGSGAVEIDEVIAGGGGGGGPVSGLAGGDGQTAPTGGDGGKIGVLPGTPGAGGGGGAAGQGGVTSSSNPEAGGGGGFTGGSFGHYTNGNGSPVQNAEGGSADGATFAGGNGGSGGGGGFGGGGGGGSSGAGGGGGFGGGGGGAGFGEGGGGGSLVNSSYGVSEGVAPATASGDGSVTIEALAPPVISVASPVAHSTSAQAPVDPFAGDAITDPNIGAPSEILTVTPSVTIDGVLRDPNAATDGSSVNAGTGEFSVSGTALAVTTALDGLVFTPSAGAAGTTTTFTISDTSSAYPLAVTDSTTVVTDAPCFCAGTLIETENGPVAVEDLVIGDRLVTLSGVARPIKWIGARSYDGQFIRGNREVLPICVRAGALGENIPSSDLWLSPHHALHLEGVLIEARELVNGVSIVQAERAKRVDYFHIELSCHDVIFAEGAEAESFIDNDSRAMFQNVADYFALYPQAAGKRRKPPSFAPRRDEGFEIEAARKSIAARAGIVSVSAPGALRGWVEGMTSGSLWGWAQDSGDPQNPVCLHVLADGCVIGRVLANRFRADLKEAGLGYGRHAFQFEAPKGVDFSKARIELRRASDHATLPCPSQNAA